METEDVVARIEARFLEGEDVPDGRVISEMARTVSDRLLIRLGADELPRLAESIVADATMKALRLRGYEGSTSESSSDGGSISNSFVDDVLAAYSEDISALKQTVHRRGVRFL